MNQNISHKIIPACMLKKFFELEEYINSVEGTVTTVQIDMMDGKFVPNKSWPFMHQELSDEYINEDHPLPQWDNIDYEFDLMVSRPLQYIDQLLTLSPARVCFHIESMPQEELEELVQKMQEYRDFVQVGLAVPSQFNPEQLQNEVEMIDYVQVMGIDTIGVQGEPASEYTCETVEAFKKLYPNLLIQIDGSVNTETIQDLYDAGADRFAVGSAVFHQAVPRNAVKNLEMLIQE